MIIKIETTGTIEYVLFRCEQCGRTFGMNMGLPRDPGIKEKMLSILNHACVCDDCVEKSRQAEKDARQAEIQRQEQAEQTARRNEGQLVNF